MHYRTRKTKRQLIQLIPKSHNYFKKTLCKFKWIIVIEWYISTSTVFHSILHSVGVNTIIIIRWHSTASDWMERCLGRICVGVCAVFTRACHKFNYEYHIEWFGHIHTKMQRNQYLNYWPISWLFTYGRRCGLSHQILPSRELNKFSDFIMSYHNYYVFIIIWRKLFAPTLFNTRSTYVVHLPTCIV